MRRGSVSAPVEPVALVIDRIGSAGDGVARPPGPGPVHVARTLPGERATVSVGPARADGARRGTLIELLAPSPERVAPPCPHFMQGCGGCALQHWEDGAYTAWKRGLVVAALRRAGFANPDVAGLQRTPPQARRRMDFAVARGPDGVTLGLHQAHSVRIVDLAVCHVARPELAALMAPLRAVLSGLAGLRRAGSVLANLTDDGPDLLLRTDGELAPTDRAKLAAFAAAHGVPRIAWAPAGIGAAAAGTVELACQTGAPSAAFGAARVSLPPGAFLQASAEGEAAIVGAVLAGLPQKLTSRSRATELFAGCGTLTFPLAARLRVSAYEGDGRAADAVRRAQAGHRVEMTQRDLARQPLAAKALSGAAAVVLDPPHVGAPAQVAEIAQSGVARVVYVSCNPAALSRDAALLAGAGYRLVLATPIDQFLWSAQVECVAVFAA